MFLYQITPLTKINRREDESFFYYGSRNLPTGALVLVNFKNRQINGVVLNSQPLLNRKLEVKKADFETKKILKVICSNPVVGKVQIEIAKWISQYYLHPLGDVLRLFLPKSLIIKKSTVSLSHLGAQKKKKKGKERIIWNRKEKRWLFYIDFLKKAKKKKDKTLICFPEIIQLEEFEDLLKKKLFLKNVLVFHGKLSQKEEFEIWQKVRKSDFEIILGTRSAIFLPFHDLDSIIIEEEENPSYKSWDQQPRYDLRLVAEQLQQNLGIFLIKGVEIPRLEIYLKIDKKKKKLPFKPRIEVIKTENKDFLTNKILNLIKKNNKSQFIFLVNRRGLAPAVFCRDCGYFLVCPQCASNFILFQNKLFCHHCGFQKIVDKKCPRCQSWRLDQLGFGSNRVKLELQKIVPKNRIEILDSLTTPNLDDQKKIINDFLKQRIRYLVATPLILKFPVFADFGIIVSAEQFLNFPEFQTFERNFQRFLKFSQQVQKLFIQSSLTETPFFKFLPTGEIQAFYQTEVKLRRQFSYPPFSKLVKFINFGPVNLKIKEDLNGVKKEMEMVLRENRIDQFFCEFVGPSPSFLPKIKNNFYWELILKIKKDQQRIKQLLYPLIPSSFIVDVDPETLL